MTSQIDQWLRQHSRYEKELATVMRKFFREQHRSIQNGIRMFGIVPSYFLFSPPAWTNQLRETVRPTLLRTATAGAVGLRKQFGKSFRKDANDVFVDLPFTVQMALQQAITDVLYEPYWEDLNKTTLERLERALRESVDQSFTIQQTSERIAQSLGEKPGEIRAYATARTETTGALNAGHYVQFQEYAREGIATGNEWSSVIDDHTRRVPRDKFDHLKMHKVVVAPGEMFNVSGELAPYPGYHKLSAGNRVFCRCTTVMVTDGERSLSRGMHKVLCGVHGGIW